MRNFFKTLLDDLPVNAKIIVIQGPYAYSGGYAWPMNGGELKKYGDALADIIPKLARKYDAIEKPVLTGFSGGGFMAYYQAAAHPLLYSHIIPVSGALSIKPVEESDYSQVKISAFHGKKDQVINFSRGAQTAADFEKADYDITFTELPGGHLSVFREGHGPFKKLFKDSFQ